MNARHCGTLESTMSTNGPPDYRDSFREFRFRKKIHIFSASLTLITLDKLPNSSLILSKNWQTKDFHTTLFACLFTSDYVGAEFNTQQLDFILISINFKVIVSLKIHNIFISLYPY
ncbi:hypothetical protein LOAG_04592 [Loa loa]|uniref:Uncharacterized protein n=1 Tax=Loa loa TaxID=7209 RepID=A0A1S0U3H2_LOALO|nr:hypothetical protein LOAG_04592 [Loa loa]EFO23892.1 hypothetical protein LOAG_04592 [Loa loa]